MTPSRERDLYFALMGRIMAGESAYVAAEAGHKLLLAASAHLRACEGACSLKPPDGTYDDCEADTYGFWSRAAHKALNRAEKVCPKDWRVNHQNDPRGGTLWIEPKPGTTASVMFNGLKLYPPAKGFPARVFERA